MKLDTNGNYLPVVYFDEFWQMKENFILINESISSLNITMTYSPISMWKWQLQSQMDQSLSMQDSLSGVEGEGDNFKVIFYFIIYLLNLCRGCTYLNLNNIAVSLCFVFGLFLFYSVCFKLLKLTYYA